MDEIRPKYGFNDKCQGSVPESIRAFLESTDCEDAIRNTISLGGDADTISAIAGEEARAGGARAVCTGRSDYPNQVNNVLCFPGLFRGALDVRASYINDAMKLAAAVKSGVARIPVKGKG